VIQRKPRSGAFGTVDVAFSTLSPSESYPFLPPLDPSTRRADYADYDYLSDVVTFVSGQIDAVVNVSIKANNRSQPDSVVFLRLNYVNLIHAEQSRPGICSHLCGFSFIAAVLCQCGQHTFVLVEVVLHTCTTL